MRRLLSLVGVLLCAGIATAHVRESLPLRESASLAEADGLAEHSGVLEGPAIDPTFFIRPSSSAPGISSLKTDVCFNGACKAPHLLYVGTDATTATWVARIDEDADGTLTNDAGGADPTMGAATPLLDSETGVLFNGSAGAGDAYVAASATVGTIDTEDFRFELVIQATNATQTIWSRYSNAESSWGLYQSGSGGWTFAVQNGASGVNITCTHTVVDRAWYRLAIYGNRDENSLNGVSFFVNGKSCGTGNISTVPAAFNGTFKMTLGDQPAGTGNTAYGRSILMAAYWKRASWFQAGAAGPAEWLAFETERQARMAMVYPVIARGAASPTATARSSAATSSKCASSVVSLHQLGADWPRTNMDCSGRAMYWSEPSVTNTFLQSRNIGTSWTKLDAGDSIAGSVTTPFGLTSTTAGLIGDGTNGDHGVTQAATVTAAVWTMSVIAKAGSKTWAYLSDNTVANATGYFNLSTCATGTKGAGAIALFGASLGGGWCEIGLSFTGTAASHTFAMQAADADLDNTVTGDGAAVMGYFTEAQLEAGGYPSSRCPTTTATATRAADTLSFTATGNASSAQGSLVCSVLFPNHNQPAGFDVGFANIIGASSANEMFLGADAGTDGGVFYVSNGGATQAWLIGSSDISVGSAQTVAGSWKANDFALYVNGGSEGTDTSGLLPAAQTTLQIGWGDTIRANAGIYACCVYDRIGVRSCP